MFEIGVLERFNRLDFVTKEISDIPGFGGEKPEKFISLKRFFSRGKYAIKLIFLEKEIVTFAALQWASIGIGYYLWIQIFDWIPEEVWQSAAESEDGSITDIVLTLWSFLCVGLVAFPVGILSGCMGATHFLHSQGRNSGIAACLKIVLPRVGPLWIFHWIDGWITVSQILERLPKWDVKRNPIQRAKYEALYYAWKLGTMGILPALLTGQELVESGKRAVVLVKHKFKDVAVLRAGYSLICWIFGISAYVGTILMFIVFDDLVPREDEIYGHVFMICFWAGVPILIAVGIIKLFVRPIYLISICDIYSEFLVERDESVELPDDPSKGVSALVAFGVLCTIFAVVYLNRYHLGIMDMLATPYGEEYRPR